MAKRASVRARGVPRREVQWIPVERLLLDSFNPRLPEGMHGADQEESLTRLAEDYSLLEIGQSLADNGYFSEEPLVAMPAAHRDGYFLVLEGNRRLAALKLLREPSIAARLRLREWRELAKNCKYPLDEVPVRVYQTRDEITPYLGFRHISGVVKWEPIAKARFINYLIKDRGITFAQVAREIGSKVPVVRGTYVTYRIVLQARDDFGIETKWVEEDFSVLYRGLSTPGIRDYISVSLDKSEKDLERPVPKRKHKELGELLLWMFGNKTTTAALKDSRQLSDLGAVLESEGATAALRSSRDLSIAFQLTGGEQRRLLDHLRDAGFHLDEALRDMHRHKRSKEVETAVRRCYGSMLEILKHFPHIEAEEE
jgi:hypothetical protein